MATGVCTEDILSKYVSNKTGTIYAPYFIENFYKNRLTRIITRITFVQ